MSILKLTVEGNSAAELIAALQAALAGLSSASTPALTGSVGDQTETKPADDKKAAENKSSTEGRRRVRAAPAPEAPKSEEKAEETTTRSRRSRGAAAAKEETAEQKALREQILNDGTDLADVPEAIPEVTEFLQRKGCKLVSDLPADDLEEAADFFAGLCEKYFKD